MADVKVIISEIDGVEIEEGYREHKLLAEDVPFDNSTNGFTADNTQTAIEEAGQSSGPATEERLISVKYVLNAGCYVRQAPKLLIDHSLCFLKKENC